ncbi:DnaJ family domain-containing protein [Micromonospora sagamiensis]|uniref:Uncharacterized protein DUF1992 n=1 Tax=Micromonospora sagamiensis TaxID=47875 RepID=A0A562WG02_9ACTN|nr:DnaJ family domain-containing protein [Micromonospora sagamiensis]TWJ29229.1 uncharacterized protein DUF1992 [Micromonospora sagamiensis]BCL17746.1 DUF1992 domain-containing protein [Micromonospora sagamiensis]
MTYAWEAAAEAQIRAAVERGEFDNLPGAGRPIPGRDLPYDEQWWIKGLLEREKIPTEALLPTPLLLRRRVERLPDEVRELPTEAAVRACAQELNTQIVAWLRTPTGPRVVVRPVDVDAVVRQWRAARSGPVPAGDPPAAAAVRPTRRRRWWRRTPRP